MVYVKVNYENVRNKIVELEPAPQIDRGVGTALAKYYEVALSHDLDVPEEVVINLSKYFTDGENIPGFIQVYSDLAETKWGTIKELQAHLINRISQMNTIIRDTEKVEIAISHFDGYEIEIDGQAATGNTYDNYITKNDGILWVREFTRYMKAEVSKLETYSRNLNNKADALEKGSVTYFYIPSK